MGGGINQTCKSAESPKSFELQAPPLLQIRTGTHGSDPAPTPSPTTLGLRAHTGITPDATPGARGGGQKDTRVGGAV